MARTRLIKPAFFFNELLGSVSRDARLLFIGLWTLADREGKLDDSPKKIKAQIFPYDDDINSDDLLWQLNDNKFIVRYSVDDCKYIKINNFLKHQHPHAKEADSIIPEPKSTEPLPRSVLAPTKESTSRAFSLLPSPLTLLPSTTLSGSQKDANADITHFDKNFKALEAGTQEYIAWCKADPKEYSPQELSHAAKQILQCLNEECGKSFRPTDTNLNFIKARLKSGVCVSTCRKLIIKKKNEWERDDKMMAYLRPSTLFNATKFEQYLGEMSV